MERVYEPLFGLDVVWDEDRSRWFDASFDAPQSFLSFGLKTDAQSRPSLGGRTVENLYACGEILAGVSAVDGREAIAASAAKVLSILTEEGHAEA